ncbi:MAG: hypothetical protein ACTSO9_15060 [Candidatus Helarchaeota archaeon]
MNRIEVLRLDYLFSVILPCLLAIYVNNLHIIDYLNLIFGWGFLGITGNLLNDIMDKDREIPFRTKELGTMGLVSFGLGIILLLKTLLKDVFMLVLAFSSIILVVLYCIKLKPFPIINKIVLVTSHVIFPYLVIKIASKYVPLRIQDLQNLIRLSTLGNNFYLGELALLATFFVFAFSSQITHEAIDQEAIQKYSLKTVQIIVQLASILTIIFLGLTMYFLQDIFLLPLAFAPIGPIYIFRRPKVPSPGIKDVGIVMGNFLMVYFLVLILQA